MGKNLVYIACASKSSTTLKAYISAISCQNSKILIQGGLLNLMDFKNGQKFGVYRMNQQIKHHFECLYLGQNKIGQGGPLNFRNFKNGQKFGVYHMYQQYKHHFEGL